MTIMGYYCNVEISWVLEVKVSYKASNPLRIKLNLQGRKQEFTNFFQVS